MSMSKTQTLENMVIIRKAIKNLADNAVIIYYDSNGIGIDKTTFETMFAGKEITTTVLNNFNVWTCCAGQVVFSTTFDTEIHKGVLQLPCNQAAK